MSYLIKRTLLIIMVLWVSLPQIFAQNEEDIMWKALKDELSRNISNLSFLDYQKPFFIGYVIGNTESAVVLGSLGAIVMSHESAVKSEMVRVMVGDYKICDENFQNENSNVHYTNANIPLPEDADYYGIRRTLWIQTDKVYKAAGESFKNKLYLLKQNNIPVDSLIPDFSKAPVNKIFIEGSKYVYNKSEWEKRVREISSSMSKYPDIDDSGVSFRFAKVNTYLVNSEGSEAKSPLNVAVISLSANATADDGTKLPDRLEMVALTPNDLPANEWFKSQSDELAQRLIRLKNAESFLGSYTGPVLFTGQAASELIAGSLFSQEDPVVSIREPLYADRNMKIFYSNNPNSLETKFNKKVIASDLTVKALPLLKEFDGTRLVGSYEVDADGIVPAKELVLIENGLLKTLLCDRTPTRLVPQSNGHRRFALFNNATSYITGPGVIEVSTKKPLTVPELKQKLIQKAKDEGLDYGILIKRVMQNNVNSPVEVYKVSVSDGKETLIKSASISNISLSTLRKCIGMSNTRVAYNMLMDVGGNMSNMAGTLTPDLSGLPVSMITPDAVLIEEMELQGANKNLSLEKPIVPNPVGQK